MSNKIVPSTYRALIDDVVGAVKGEFDQWGVDESVLHELRQLWMDKVTQSNVADFEPQPPTTAPASSGPAGVANGNHAPVYGSVQPPVKSEQGDYTLGGPVSAGGAPPPPPGMIPYAHGAAAVAAAAQLRASGPGGASRPIPHAQLLPPYVQHAMARALPARPVSTDRIPQVDGPSRPPNGMPSSSHPSLPPASHPSLLPTSTSHVVSPPKPSQARPAPASTSRGPRADPTSDAINSDLDDSDSDGNDDDDADGAVQDIVFCTYDKVARVKNKWKTTLKDGIIHVNGKDYLFSKCNGEFEW
ncbi:transcription factor IIA, alpha/beta subunit-domain-containing protein [Auriculariales sp. MPI-PUGE-AT-0066]|nr:transcription factor IIA, alpha/beta subunit-domain-containing protein [Auriculariales sp. MPI-PUGE-AT-0066]